ncbi:MAG: NTP transferase domain-containing protein, partial [Deltaproteobacteria bacterium]|nr:NTP transferase domain-containing protein [Deltaproteobacteria bacterium]
MKCLIIAAGRGSRLSTKVDSKPLIPLLGLSLIERVILTAKKGGLTDFYVVTGYNGEKVRKYLNRFSQSRNINITHITNEEWERGNGISVLKAKKLLNENFVLLMGDHIFDESILVRLKDEKIADGEVMLAVDYNIKTNKLVDVNDVTKVLVEENRILDIGKNIKKYNAYDTGIFLCSPAIFTAIEESLHNDDSSLSGGIRVLASKGKAKAFDIKGDFWIDVDDDEAFKKAEKLLQGNLIKPADGLISRYINRKFSTRIFTPLLLKTHRGITPNQVSILSFIVGLISSLYFFLGHAIIGALLIQISSILDGCDGEIARLKHMQSSLGDFIDAVLDRYVDGLIFLGIFYYSLIGIGNKETFGFYWSPLIIFIIFGFAILGHLMISYTSAKSVANFGYKYKGKLIAAGRGRDFRLFLLFIGGMMTYFHPIFVLFAVIIIAIQANRIVILRTFLSWDYFLKRDSLIRSKVKAVIFDFDGTIANTMHFLTGLGVKLMTEEYNISKSEAKKRYLETTGLDFASQLELIFPNHPNNQNVATTFESKKLEGIFVHPIFPEVIPTLKYFRNKKIKTFI